MRWVFKFFFLLCPFFCMGLSLFKTLLSVQLCCGSPLWGKEGEGCRTGSSDLHNSNFPASIRVWNLVPKSVEGPQNTQRIRIPWVSRVPTKLTDISLSIKNSEKNQVTATASKIQKKIKLQPHLFIPKCIKETFRLFGDEEFTARGELGAAHAGTRGSASRKIHGTDFLTQLGWSSTPALGCLGLLFILFQINFLQALN